MNIPISSRQSSRPRTIFGAGDGDPPLSEDIDIFVDPNAFQPQLGKRAINRALKRLRDAVAAHSGLTFVPGESHTIGGFGRTDCFAYEQRFGGPGEVAGRVLIEAGAASGREPKAIVELRSYLSQFLQERGVSLGAEDESSFSLPLLHFRRTFVEKMFAIHSKVELLKRDRQPLGTYARHYYDLFQLGAREEVIAMLKSFARSDALFPSAELAASIAAEYEGQCRLLCYGPYPSWDAIQARLAELRGLL